MENSETKETLPFGLSRKDFLFTILILIFFIFCFFGIFSLDYNRIKESFTDKDKIIFVVFQIGTLLALTITSFYVNYSKKNASFFYLALFWLAHAIYKVFNFIPVPLKFSNEGKIKNFLGIPGESVGEIYALIAIIALAADLPLLLSSFPQKQRKLWLFLIPIGTFVLMVIIFNLKFDIISKIRILYFISPTHSFLIFLWLSYSIISKNVFDVSKKLSRYFGITFIAFAVSQIPFVYQSYCIPQCPENDDAFELVQRIFSLLIFVFALIFTLLVAKENLSGIHKEKNTAEADLYRTKILLSREKELNEQILLQKKEFEDLYLVASSVEHELRNPLAVINSGFIALRTKYQSDARLIKYLDNLEAERLSMEAAVDLVNILKSDNEDITFRKKKIYLKDLFNKIKKKVEIEFKGKLADIHIKIDEKKQRLFVNATPFLLEKVFINFIKNAIESILLKESKKGEIDIELDVDENDKNIVIIRIKDDGIGFVDKDGKKLSDEEIKECISAKYTTKTADISKPNKGIGLFVSDRVVRIHEGEMKMRNNEDEGAEVTVTLERIIE